MESGHEEANWKRTKWILALVERCQSEGASKGPLRPEYWDIPERERKLIEKQLQHDRTMAAGKDAADDPEKLAAFRAARIAEFNRFRAQFRG